MIATQSPASVRRDDVTRILEHVEPYASRPRRPALAVLVGLPASGKSRVAEELRARTGAVVLESDELRRLLFRRRTYSPMESQRLFAAVHAAIERLLADGASVLLDATNVAEAERRPLYKIAERRRARLVVVKVTAPESAIRRRLAKRETTPPEAGSKADIAVYERMRARVEEIGRSHHVVDTSRDIEPALAAIAKEIAGR